MSNVGISSATLQTMLIKDLTITGDGLITGLGRQWWPCKYTGCWRPHLIVLSSVTGAKIGPLHMTDGPNHFIEVWTTTIVHAAGGAACTPKLLGNSLPVHLSLLRLTCWVLGQATDCTNVRVQGLIATAPNNSPNTDGMNFYGGHDQSIVDSVRRDSPVSGRHEHNALPK